MTHRRPRTDAASPASARGEQAADPYLLVINTYMKELAKIVESLQSRKVKRIWRVWKSHAVWATAGRTRPRIWKLDLSVYFGLTRRIY
ncbi:hypothetical protein C2S51_001066 [Perilla frutescens var. frutescens]|nr:hypothetical protein C2S51_001066 [Perilla frutescens var. frutescens]